MSARSHSNRGESAASRAAAAAARRQDDAEDAHRAQSQASADQAFANEAPRQAESQRSNSHRGRRQAEEPSRSDSHRGRSTSRRGERQQHPQFEADIENGELTLAAYEVKELAQALRTNALLAPLKFAEQLTNTQGSIFRQALVENLVTWPNNEQKRYLDTWVGIFDTAFFFNRIRPEMVGGFSLYRKEGSRKQGSYDVATKNIRINTWDTEDDALTFTGRMVGVILQAMLTAFFELYACKCSDCRRRKSARDGGLGATGHGPPWLNAMVSIQMELQKEVIWKVDGRIREALEMEMAAGQWQPRPEQLARWGIGDLGENDNQNAPQRQPSTKKTPGRSNTTRVTAKGWERPITGGKRQPSRTKSGKKAVTGWERPKRGGTVHGRTDLERERDRHDRRTGVQEGRPGQGCGCVVM